MLDHKAQRYRVFRLYRADVVTLLTVVVGCGALAIDATRGSETFPGPVTVYIVGLCAIGVVAAMLAPGPSGPRRSDTPALGFPAAGVAARGEPIDAAAEPLETDSRRRFQLPIGVVASRVLIVSLLTIAFALTVAPVVADASDAALYDYTDAVFWCWGPGRS
jgi:hypothetical protein